MKRILLFPAFLLFAAGLRLVAQNSAPPAPPGAQPSSSLTPVVVELFTSEGCSSCPPADLLLSKMESAQPFKGVQIIAIEEHVDYWNQQGWVDPFSSIEWTDRQQVYVAALRQEGPYTPQMVVNGQAQFIGSRADQAVKAVEQAQGAPATAVKLQPAPAGNPAELRFSVSVGKIAQLSPGDSAEVWFALTESGLSSQVSRGENAGRNLSHASVLRSLRRIGSADARADRASFEGEAAAKVKSNWKRGNLSAVVLVQERKSRRILGAASEKISN